MARISVELSTWLSKNFWTGFSDDKKFVAVEKCYKVRLNGKFFKNIFCSPSDIEDLIVGVIAQEKVSQPAQILTDVKFVAKDILSCADKLLSELSTTHDKTNGGHSGILFDGKKFCFFAKTSGGTMSLTGFLERLLAKIFFSVTRL